MDWVITNDRESDNGIVGFVLFVLVFTFWYWIRKKSKKPPSDNRFFIETIGITVVIYYFFTFLRGVN